MKGVLRRGLAMLRDQKRMTVLIAFVLICSVLLTAVGQMFLTTDEDKIIGRMLCSYGVSHVSFFEHAGVSEDVMSEFDRRDIPYVLASDQVIFVGGLFGRFSQSICVDTMAEAEAVGIEFYEGAQPALENNWVYLSDYCVETYYGLTEEPNNYSQFVGAILTEFERNGGKPVQLAGVFRTDWRQYCELETDQWGDTYFVIGDDMTRAEEVRSRQVWELANTVICKDEFLILNEGSFSFNGEYYDRDADGASLLCGYRYESFAEVNGVERDLGNIALEIAWDEEGSIHEELPEKGELIISEQLYDLLFPGEADEGFYTHVGDYIEFTVNDYGTDHVRATYGGILADVRTWGSGCTIIGNSGEIIDAFLPCHQGLTHRYLVADISDPFLDIRALMKEMDDRYSVGVSSPYFRDLKQNIEYFQAPWGVFVAITCVGVALFVVAMTLLGIMLRRSVKSDRAENESLLADVVSLWKIRAAYLVKVLAIALISFALATPLTVFAAWLVGCLYNFNFADPIPWMAYDPVTFIVSFSMSFVLPLLIALIPLRKINASAPAETVRGNG